MFLSHLSVPYITILYINWLIWILVFLSFRASMPRFRLDGVVILTWHTLIMGMCPGILILFFYKLGY